jgi:DNA processing protein
MTSIPTRSAHGLAVLLGLRGIGPHTAEKLATAFPTLDVLRDAPATEISRHVSSAAAASLGDETAWSGAVRSAEVTLHQAERMGIRLVTVFDRDYPGAFKTLSDRPVLLYVQGQMRVGPRKVACIGTRTPSRFGEEVTRRIVGFLVERSWSIVSGLATGVDAIAHRSCLEMRGHTIAVLANGLDSVYPKKNSDLAEAILSAGGALVSEQPFGAPATPRNLVQRDRLQSGLSLATIPMQTDITGGSMHTVRYTLMQKRLLFAPVPQGAHADEPGSRGILALTQRSGPELAGLVNADGDYAALLRSNFAAVPPAIPLRGRDDYNLLASKLENAAEMAERFDHRPRQASLF